MGELKKWRDEKWVKDWYGWINKGACGTSKNKKNPDRCLPLAKARSMRRLKELKQLKRKEQVLKERQ